MIKYNIPKEDFTIVLKKNSGKIILEDEELDCVLKKEHEKKDILKK